ncbi:MAG: family 20 glycosylhydrolase [Candidatus Aminicenantes bacterium]|nr:family 20 glycosylhydrolase [Candidatus Aminicenantes bacterium]
MPLRISFLRSLFILLLGLGAAGAASAAVSSLDLLPRPSTVLETEGRFPVDESFTVGAIGDPGDRARRAADRFLERLSGRTGLFLRRDDSLPEGGESRASFVYRCDRAGALVPGEEESYRLTVSPDRILLIAPTDLGILHGFETVLQLLKGGPGGYFVPCVQIEDVPRFPWRGLMIDSGRHFQPVDVIKRNIDGLAAVKMNVLHWHLTEDQGFRVESRIFPALHELGSDGRYYSQAQIRDIVAYAADRGIRVMPEFDIPGHSTSWFPGFPELASAPGPYRISRTYSIQLPAFNPGNPNVYAFLDAFLGEMAALFPDPFLHIGGDENNGKHWDANPEIQDFKKKKGLADNAALQAYFNIRLLEILKKHGRRMVGWDEILQPGLPRDIVIQSWRGTEALVEAARRGYAGLLSNGYYIDLCQPAGEHYLNDPLPAGHGLSAEEAALVWGGEATMWSELASWETIDSRIWPRTAAIAERLWSPAEVRDVDDMYRRLEIVSIELEELGLTHLKNRDMMLRRLIQGTAIEPLQTLADAVEPLRGYKRHSLGKVKTTLAPLTRFVDAVPPESSEARLFGRTVDSFLAHRDAGSAEALKMILETWRMNHDFIKPLLSSAPVLFEIEPLSRGLSEAAEIGLEAVEALGHKRKGHRTQAAARMKTLAELKKPLAELELAVVPAIERLVSATIGD